jgi:hypothetical protein
MAKNDDLPNIGEVLVEEFLEPMNISQNALAKALGIPQNRKLWFFHIIYHDLFTVSVIIA